MPSLSWGGLGQTNVWTRAPDGTLLQRSFYGSDTYIDSLSSDGEVMLINSGKRYLSDRSGKIMPINSRLGKSIKINDVWYVTIGRTLFKLNSILQ